MNEEELIETWNKQRGQIISAQMQPVLVLIATFVLSALGYFDKATDEAKYFALVVVAVTGILTTLNQYAAIREGEAVCDDLAKIAKKSALATKIAKLTLICISNCSLNRSSRYRCICSCIPCYLWYVINQ
jgi:hypothetical protein